MKVLITGITGMVGSHLADYILNNHPDAEVSGVVRWRSPLDNIRQRLDDITLIQGELRDLSSMIQVINQVQPDRIFHLAAQSFVPISYESPGDTFTVNVIGSINLLDAVRNVGIDPMIHMCSSAEVYGNVDESMVPITVGVSVPAFLSSSCRPGPQKKKTNCGFKQSLMNNGE